MKVPNSSLSNACTFVSKSDTNVTIELNIIVTTTTGFAVISNQY
jgi:hypothetical protein